VLRSRNPCHAPCNTKLSSPPTILLSNWRNPLRNCRDLREGVALLVLLAALVERLVVLALSMGIHGDALDSTSQTCQKTKCPAHQLRN